MRCTKEYNTATTHLEDDGHNQSINAQNTSHNYRSFHKEEGNNQIMGEMTNIEDPSIHKAPLDSLLIVILHHAPHDQVDLSREGESDNRLIS